MHYSFKEAKVNFKLQGVLDELNKLKLPNKIVLIRVFQLLRKIYDNREFNNWGHKGALAAVMDGPLSPHQLSPEKSTEMNRIGFPMLSHIINNFGDEYGGEIYLIYFDFKDHKFKQKKTT